MFSLLNTVKSIIDCYKCYISVAYIAHNCMHWHLLCVGIFICYLACALYPRRSEKISSKGVNKIFYLYN